MEPKLTQKTPNVVMLAKKLTKSLHLLTVQQGTKLTDAALLIRTEFDVRSELSGGSIVTVGADQYLTDLAGTIQWILEARANQRRTIQKVDFKASTQQQNQGSLDQGAQQIGESQAPPPQL